MITIRFDKKYAMDEACSSDKDRPVLWGVYIDLTEKRAIGCDGRMLAACPIEIDGENNGDESIIIPKECWKTARTSRLDEAIIAVEKNACWTFNKNIVKMEFCLVPGQYPNFQQVIPPEGNRVWHTSFDPNILLRGHKAMGVKDGGLKLAQAGVEGPGVWRVSDRELLVVMPQNAYRDYDFDLAHYVQHGNFMGEEVAEAIRQLVIKFGLDFVLEAINQKKEEAA
jgi:hypothetical protein